ncbi:uncharacterized protein LOC133550472 [Nerophis ophidion]|uniref:uncharacterized protein LOC133550472 n=1 Tax=Nerophis ophidion TaxID=159077 RepID=UPI002AE05844|nr:uncharacterized protein LOC133550472 [Nerophis ophidion]
MDVLDGKGVYPSKNKVIAIHDVPAPRNVKELRAFLGLVNYYGRFVPQQSTILAPLYRLMKDKVKWRWGEAEQSAFGKCKELLTSDKVLVHYDPRLPLSLACDASAYGIGAVIQHTTLDGHEHPIAYASRTLSPAEKNYSQIEKEALSLVFGVKKFHQYLWGRKFDLISDHKPLLALFGEHERLPTMAAARLQRWAIILSAYDYHRTYRRSEEHGNVDGLSRVPLPETKDTGYTKGHRALKAAQIWMLRESASSVRPASWNSARHAKSRCIPGIFPGELWKRLHTEFAGPFLGHMFMIVVDAYSKWLEVYKMAQITSTATITRLKRLFASFGVPEQIVTDNATTFTSDEFQQFIKRNGVLHTTGMKKLVGQNLSVEDKISHILLRYRTTPHSTTGESPADLFLKRHVRTRLDFLKPSITERVRKRQYQQKEKHDSQAAERQFDVNDSVSAQHRRRETQMDSWGSDTTDWSSVIPSARRDTRPSIQSLQVKLSQLSGTDSAEPEPPAFELEPPVLPDPETVTLRRSERTIRRPQRL